MPAYRKADAYSDCVQVQHRAPDLFGSGRVIGHNLVLTALHVVTPTQSNAQQSTPVRSGWHARREGSRVDGGVWKWDDGEVIWTGKDVDLALLQVRPRENNGDWRPRLRLRPAKINQAQLHTVYTVGFPEGAQAKGKRILTAPTGRLKDEHRSTLTLEVNSASVPNRPDANWRGLSGAAVFFSENELPGSIWIYGVAQQVPANFPQQLDVARLEVALRDPEFCGRLMDAGVTVMTSIDPLDAAEWGRLVWPIEYEIIKAKAGLLDLDSARAMKKGILSKLLKLRNWLETKTIQNDAASGEGIKHLLRDCDSILVTINTIDPAAFLTITEIDGVQLLDELAYIVDQAGHTLSDMTENNHERPAG